MLMWSQYLTSLILNGEVTALWVVRLTTLQNAKIKIKVNITEICISTISAVDFTLPSHFYIQYLFYLVICFFQGVGRGSNISSNTIVKTCGQKDLLINLAPSILCFAEFSPHQHFLFLKC